jgi:hypothetical protein
MGEFQQSFLAVPVGGSRIQTVLSNGLSVSWSIFNTASGRIVCCELSKLQVWRFAGLQDLWDYMF